MLARPWQSSFLRSCVISEHILDLSHSGFFTFLHFDLDHIKAPREIACAETPQPLVCTAPDQRLFLSVHGREPADHRVLTTGFHLNKQQLPAFSRDNIDLASSPAFEVSREDLDGPRAQPVGGDIFPVVTLPFTGARCSRPLPVGRVEIPAETSDDDGDKAHVCVELRDVPACHSLGAWRNHTRGIPYRYSP